MSMGEWLLDDDAELLGATLSLVAAWDQQEEQRISSACVSSDATRDSQPSDGSETDAPTVSVITIKTENTANSRKTVSRNTKPAAPTTSSRSRGVNTSRERRKTEIETLRGESQQLESQLLTLQTRREWMLRAHYNGLTIQNTAPVWETLARRQLQACKRSQAHNETLRAKAAEPASGRTRPDAGHPGGYATSDARMSEQQQLARLHANFAKSQWALSLSPKFERGELQFRDFRVVETDKTTAIFDTYGSYVLPYTVASVARVGWSIFQKPTDGFDENDGDEVDKYVQEHTTHGDEIIAAFSMESTMGGATASQGRVYGKWVARQEARCGGGQHQINTQWRYEFEGFGNELDGISVVEDTWLRIVDAKEIGHERLSEPLAVLQLVSRLHINLNPSHHIDRRHVATVTELFKTATEGQLRAVERDLENTLMVEALHNKKPVL